MSTISRPAVAADDSEYLPDTSKVIKTILETYPPKVARKRAKHITLNDPFAIPEIEANVRTIPGIISQRGCCYAGCKGVVLGPIKDIVHIVVHHHQILKLLII